LDLGQFEQAEASFRRWPVNDRGHAYWKWRAIIFDEVLHQHEEALAAYGRALEIWPGPADWRLHHRRAGCLTRLRKSEAAVAQERAAQVRALMTAENHDRLRAVLGSLDDAEQLAEVVQFYRKLGRKREADCWESHIRHLSTRVQEPQ